MYVKIFKAAQDILVKVLKASKFPTDRKYLKLISV